MDTTKNPATRIMLFIELNFVDEDVQVPNFNEKTKVSEVKLILEDRYPRQLRNRSYYLKLKLNQTRLDDDHTLEHYGIRDRSILELEFVDTPTSSPPPSERPPLSLWEKSHMDRSPTNSSPPSEHPPLRLREKLGDADTIPRSKNLLVARDILGRHRTAVDRDDYSLLILYHYALRNQLSSKRKSRTLILRKPTSSANSTTLNVNSKTSVGFHYEPDHKLVKYLTEFIKFNLTTTYLNFTSIYNELYKTQLVNFINIQTELLLEPIELFLLFEKMRDLLDKTNDMSTLLRTGKQAPKNISNGIKMDKHGYSGKLSYAAQKSLHSMTYISENTGRIMPNAFPQVVPQEYTQVVHTQQIKLCSPRIAENTGRMMPNAFPQVVHTQQIKLCSPKISENTGRIMPNAFPQVVPPQVLAYCKYYDIDLNVLDTIV